MPTPRSRPQTPTLTNKQEINVGPAQDKESKRGWLKTETSSTLLAVQEINPAGTEENSKKNYFSQPRCSG